MPQEKLTPEEQAQADDFVKDNPPNLNICPLCRKPCAVPGDTAHAACAGIKSDGHPYPTCLVLKCEKCGGEHCESCGEECPKTRYNHDWQDSCQCDTPKPVEDIVADGQMEYRCAECKCYVKSVPADKTRFCHTCKYALVNGVCANTKCPA